MAETDLSASASSGTLQSRVEKLEAKLSELSAANDQLKAVDRFKSGFISAISHELSTPLTPLFGYLKILKAGRLGPLNEQQLKVLEAMLLSAERLARTIDNLADLASLEGGSQLRPAPFDPVALASQLVAEANRGEARGKRVHLATTCTGRPGAVVGDARLLSQALGNLIENAVKCSPHGGEILVEVACGSGRVLFAVYDQGPGIPPEEQSKIFDSFFLAGRGSGSAERVPSAGLGLAVARKIAEAHGGRLLLESPPKSQPEGEHGFAGAKLILEIPEGPIPTAGMSRA